MTTEDKEEMRKVRNDARKYSESWAEDFELSTLIVMRMAWVDGHNSRDAEVAKLKAERDKLRDIIQDLIRSSENIKDNFINSIDKLLGWAVDNYNSLNP